MSRRLEKTDTGYVQILEDRDRCRWLIDEICCEPDSDLCTFCPGEEDCKSCPFFTKEEVEQ